MEPITEKIGDEENEDSGILEEKLERQEDPMMNDEDDIGRSPEVIDLAAIDGRSKHDLTPKTDLQSEAQTDNSTLTTPKQRALNINDFDVSSKQGFKQLLRFQMRIFDLNYDFDTDQLVGGEAEYQGDPTLEELYYFCKYVIISGRMEKEIPILCLVYIERFLTKSGLLMNFSNWKRLTLISLILASKIWDDDSLENVHFP